MIRLKEELETERVASNKKKENSKAQLTETEEENRKITKEYKNMKSSVTALQKEITDMEN